MTSQSMLDEEEQSDLDIGAIRDVESMMRKRDREEGFAAGKMRREIYGIPI